MATTLYVVLSLDSDAGYTIMGEAEAANDQQAITKVLSEDPFNKEGVFVAVPKRSWKPRTVAPKQAFKFS